MSRLFDRLAAKQMPMGTMMMEHGPEWMEILGYVGLDYGIVDMMNAPIDWGEAANMIRAMDRYNVTPFIRLQSYPWASNPFDSRLPADVFRALGLGAEGVIVSLNDADTLERLMVPLREDNENEWVHTRPYINRPLYGVTEPLRRDDDKRPRRMVVPDLESPLALKNLDSILEVKDLQTIMVSLADISQAIGHPFDYDHPEMIEIVRDCCKRAAAKGVYVMTFTAGQTPQDVARRAQLLWDLGVKIIYSPRLTIAAQRFYEQVLHIVHEQKPDARP